jgi:glycosyltransferase involved in cell wall biosynthesis
LLLAEARRLGVENNMVLVGRLPREDGPQYVRADEDAFARAIVRLLNAPEEARVMGGRGRRYVVEHRSYGVIANRVERELHRIASSARK